MACVRTMRKTQIYFPRQSPTAICESALRKSILLCCMRIVAPLGFWCFLGFLLRPPAALGASVTPGQVLVGDPTGAGFAPQTIGGDGTINSNGTLTVTKSKGVAFAPPRRPTREMLRTLKLSASRLPSGIGGNPGGTPTQLQLNTGDGVFGGAALFDNGIRLNPREFLSFTPDLPELTPTSRMQTPAHGSILELSARRTSRRRLSSPHSPEQR